MPLASLARSTGSDKSGFFVTDATTWKLPRAFGETLRSRANRRFVSLHSFALARASTPPSPPRRSSSVVSRVRARASVVPRQTLSYHGGIAIPSRFVARPRVARRADPRYPPAPPTHPSPFASFRASRASRASFRASPRASSSVFDRVPFASRVAHSSPTHRNGSNPFTAPNCARAAVDFCVARARATTRGRATLESVCAIIVSSRCAVVDASRASSRGVARLFRPTPRSLVTCKPIETSRSSSPPAPRHRSVRHSGRDFMGFIVRALSRVARRSSRIVLDLKPMYYARRARGRRHRIRR